MANAEYTYIVEYRMTRTSEVESVTVKAFDKWMAWEDATCYIIPEKHGRPAFNVWVYAVQYKNGKTRVIAKSESMF